MTDLCNIPGIGKTSLELLEAAGYLDARALSTAGADDLAAELQSANSILQIAKQVPSSTTVAKWIVSARKMTGSPDQPARSSGSSEPAVSSESSIMPVNYEATPEGASLMAAALVAIPLPARVLMSNQLAVGDIPPATLLSHHTGELDVRTKRRLPENRAVKTAPESNHFVRLAESTGQKHIIDTTRMRSTTNPGEPVLKPAKTRSASADDRVALIRTTRSETNKGRDPQSRRYIRGVLHSHPIAIYAGAVTSLLLILLAPLALVSAMLLLLSGEMPDQFSWVPGWLILFPLILPVFGICYLIWGLGGSCRICGQKLFRHRHHLKNPRAHRFPGLGYVFPLCIHILLFHWFRCTHCGTPVRLKE